MIGFLNPSSALACCSVSSKNVPAINADQTVILLWDQQRQVEHFIRKASFRSQGDSVGFLVPSPSRPQLEESGNEAFQYLAEITAPSTKGGGFSLGCSALPADTMRSPGGVRVIEEKEVAGYETVVLAADSGEALVNWLKEHQYAYTPEVATWAKPYLDQKWYMIAMKIAKRANDKEDPKLNASALRISFKTDRPLFPYREPDSRKDAAALEVKDRILRIYFIADANYEGKFPTEQAWTGKLMWSHPLSDDQRTRLLTQLKLDKNIGPAKFWLSEFVDHWPYGIAPGDVYFSRAEKQIELGLNACSPSSDPVFPCMVAAGLLWPILRRVKTKRHA